LKIFDTKRDEVTGGWRKMTSGELQQILLGCQLEEDGMGGTWSTNRRDEK